MGVEELVGAEFEFFDGEAAGSELFNSLGADVEGVGRVGHGQSHGGIENEGSLSGEVVKEPLGSDAVVAGVEQDVALEIDTGDRLAQNIVRLNAVGLVSQFLELCL